MAKDPRVGSGNIEFELDGEMITLKPTVGALQTISRRFNGLSKCVQQLNDFDFEAVVSVISIARDVGNPREIEELAENVHKLPPFYIMTGFGDEQIAVEMMKLGLKVISMFLNTSIAS